MQQFFIPNSFALSKRNFRIWCGVGNRTLQFTKPGEPLGEEFRTVLAEVYFVTEERNPVLLVCVFNTTSIVAGRFVERNVTNVPLVLRQVAHLIIERH